MNINFRTIFSLLTFGDKFLVLSLVLAALSSFSILGFISREGQLAIVRASNSKKMTKPLLVDQDFSITGSTGITRIKIANGSIQIIDSDCPRKLCVRQGAIKNVGEILVCVPNKITIWIEGENRLNKFDAITG